MEEIIPNVQRINEAARAKGVPVFYTTNVYRNRDATSGTNDMGLWYSKIPVETLPADSYWAQIDDRIAPADGEVVIEKNRASAFPGTNLELFLTSNRIDTLIVTGATAAGCVRHTVEDAIAKGFRPIIPRETIGDRVPGVVQWNLYDIDNKFGDVEPTDSVVEYLNNLPQFEDTVPKTLSDPQPEIEAPAVATALLLLPVSVEATTDAGGLTALWLAVALWALVPAVQAAIKHPDTVKKFNDIGFDVVANTGAEFNDFLAAEIKRWASTYWKAVHPHNLDGAYQFSQLGTCMAQNCAGSCGLGQ